MIYSIQTDDDLYNFQKQFKYAVNIKVYCKNGTSKIGSFYGYTKAIDNDPEIASIVIEDETGQLHGYCQDEIDNIEVME
ncbi:MAG: hypothetical protein ACTTH8_06390 [Treponema sp.]